MKRSDRRTRFGQEAQPLSAGRVEYLEKARRRVQARRQRRTVLIVMLLAALVVWITGAAGSSIALAKDLVDSMKIALLPRQGYPQQTGIFELYQAEPLAGGYVLLGKEGCTVWSSGGSRLNSIQTNYARPALAAGKNHFVLYNRSGTELRVESRTQNLYAITTENKIYLCGMADDGTLAVVTEDPRTLARLTVYSPSMEEQLRWSVTTAEGTPLRLAFSPDANRLAVATLTAKDSTTLSNLYLLPVQEGEPVCLGVQPGSVPAWVGWVSAREILVLYNDCAVLYDAANGEKARYDFGGRTLAGFSVSEAGTALLFEGQAVLLDNKLGVSWQGAVPSANRIVRTRDGFYLLCEESVEAFGSDGVYQWSEQLEARPEALLPVGEKLLLFCSNTAQFLAPPEAEE